MNWRTLYALLLVLVFGPRSCVVLRADVPQPLDSFDYLERTREGQVVGDVLCWESTEQPPTKYAYLGFRYRSGGWLFLGRGTSASEAGCRAEMKRFFKYPGSIEIHLSDRLLVFFSQPPFIVSVRETRLRTSSLEEAAALVKENGEYLMAERRAREGQVEPPARLDLEAYHPFRLYWSLYPKFLRPLDFRNGGLSSRELESKKCSRSLLESYAEQELQILHMRFQRETIRATSEFADPLYRPWMLELREVSIDENGHFRIEFANAVDEVGRLVLNEALEKVSLDYVSRPEDYYLPECREPRSFESWYGRPDAGEEPDP